MSVALAANILHEDFATKIIDVHCRESAATGSDAHAEKKLAATREFVTQGHSFFSTFQDTTPIYNGDHPNLAKLEAVLFYFQSWAEESGAENSGKEGKHKFIPHGECFYDIKLTIISVITFIKYYLGCGSALGQMVESFGIKAGSVFVNLSKLHQDYCEHFFQHARQSMGSHQNGEGLANAAMTAKQQALLFNITGVGKGGNSNTGAQDVTHGGMIMKKKVEASRRKALRSLDLLRHDDMADYKDVHARMAASVAARASAFAANIEAQICQLEVELPWLECLDAQATANSVLAGAV